MSVKLPDLMLAIPAATLDIAEPTLAVAVPTAMLLVDYALAGLATPTPEPQAAAAQLPAALVKASHPVRAALVHGSELRRFVVENLPADHPGHRDWPALRTWLSELTDDQVLGLIAVGIRAVIAEDEGTPRDIAPGDAAAVLKMWRVSKPSKRAAELERPAQFRVTLVDLLDAIWDLWLSNEWGTDGSAWRSRGAGPSARAGYSGSQWVSAVTGLRPDPQYAEVVDGATHVTVMSCPGLGRSLSLLDASDRTWVLHSPVSVDDRRPAGDRAGVTLANLGRLTPVMQALGDPTRLAIILQLLQRGPSTMQELTDALSVHQTTISRQVAALRKSGLVSQDDQRRIVVEQDEIRSACQTLLDELE